MNEVKDEILSGSPKYRIRDNLNNILYDNLTIEQITPIVQAGTSINKALFENYKANIELVNKYNMGVLNDNIYSFNNKIDEYATNMIILTDFKNNIQDFDTRIFPVMASQTQDGYSVSGSSNGFKLFDNNGDTYDSTRDDPIIMMFPKFIKPTSIYLKSRNESNSTREITIRGILGDNSTEILYQNNEALSYQLINQVLTITSDKFYKGIQILATGTTGTSAHKVFEVSINSGQYIDVNPNNNIYIDINNLGAKLINDSNFDVNKKYELVYDGTVFNPTEVI